MLRQLVIATLVGLALSVPNPKIDGQLWQVLNGRGVASIVVCFEETDGVVERVDAMRFVNRGAKITTLKSNLEAHAALSQKSALHFLEARGVPYESMWIANRIFITEANAELVEQLALLEEVKNIREQFVAYIDEPIPASDNGLFAEWGVEKIEAPSAWALPGGNNGQGVVVATIDTGVRYTHEALQNNYRGPYGWYDPHSRGPNPIDDSGHGTHTMGTICGGNGIGIAPGAQWMSCRGCVGGGCSELTLVACGQFLVCPHLANGQNPDCNKAPNLVSNSWGGYQGGTWSNPVITSWRSAGIVPFFSIGNTGPECANPQSPGDKPNIIAVGSTTNTDGISSFSSRGPTFGGLVKPDISAPGTDIRSAWHNSDTDYNTISGTSMACPHAAGTAALLLSQNPNLTYDQVKNLLQDNAERNLENAATCGDTPPSVFPNNMYGYGRINARNSLASAISGF